MNPSPDSPADLLHRCFMGDGLDRLEAVTALIQDLVRETDHAALTARSEGATWDEIADALGITRQAAHHRWSRIADRIERGLDRPPRVNGN